MNKTTDIRSHRLDASVVRLMSQFVRHVQKSEYGSLRLHDKDIILKMAELVHSTKDQTLSKLFNDIVVKLGLTASMLDKIAQENDDLRVMQG